MKYNKPNENLNIKQTIFKCDLCNYSTYNQDKWKKHLDKKKHKKYQNMKYDDILKSKKNSFKALFNLLCVKVNKYVK